VLDGLTDWITRIVDTLGYVGVAALVALENVFPPIPSELILPLAGFETSQGDFNYFLMVIAATIGSVVGALVLYYLAHYFGERRVRWLVRRYGKWFQVKEEDIDKADDWFDRYSGLAVLICRCIPLVRSLVSIPAGFRRMAMGKFLLYTTIGSAIWNAALIGAGWALGDNWHLVEDYVGYFQYVVIAVIAILVVLFLYHRVIKRDRTTAA
jgi:membrane protein DedA with SNARE-associated domain